MGKYNNGYATPCGVYPRRLMTIYYDMKQRCYYDKHRMFHLYRDVLFGKVMYGNTYQQ